MLPFERISKYVVFYIYIIYVLGIIKRGLRQEVKKSQLTGKKSRLTGKQFIYIATGNPY